MGRGRRGTGNDRQGATSERSRATAMGLGKRGSGKSKKGVTSEESGSTAVGRGRGGGAGKAVEPLWARGCRCFRRHVGAKCSLSICLQAMSTNRKWPSSCVEKRYGRCGVGWGRGVAVGGWGGKAVWPLWRVGLGRMGLGWARLGWGGLGWVVWCGAVPFCGSMAAIPKLASACRGLPSKRALKSYQHKQC